MSVHIIWPLIELLNAMTSPSSVRNWSIKASKLRDGKASSTESAFHCCPLMDKQIISGKMSLLAVVSEFCFFIPIWDQPFQVGEAIVPAERTRPPRAD